ncbi:MAG: patatin-like phospholipase family protein [Deltaproteobacteria bacterium]|nr:patatin-like phospholipase family protein [Deltaproteobacteria bacterium]
MADLAYESVVWAGGGNRCLWQVGFWEVVGPHLPRPPRVVAGVSAGATMACLMYGEVEDRARAEFSRATAQVKRNFDPSQLLRGERPFPHLRVYSGILRAALDQAALERLRQGPEIRVLVAVPPSWCGPVTGAVLGILLYSLEKALLSPLHPRWPALFGFVPRVARVADCSTAEDLVQLLLATSCTPPFLPPMYQNGRPVLDGGLIDNVPVAALRPADTPSLVLLTRRYRPELLTGHSGRTYLMPSSPIGIQKWDYTNPSGAEDARRLGREDGLRFLERGPAALQR